MQNSAAQFERTALQALRNQHPSGTFQGSASARSASSPRNGSTSASNSNLGRVVSSSLAKSSRACPPSFCRKSPPGTRGALHPGGPLDKIVSRWGLKLSERGGRNAKKRAVVAVARKLAVLLHKLWVSKEIYEPLRNNRKEMAQVA